MFIKVPMKIFDYRLSGNEMKVYLYLARIKNDSEIAMAKRETIRMRCVTKYAYEHLGLRAPGESGQQALEGF